MSHHQHVEMVATWLRLLIEPGQVFEIRALGVGGSGRVHSGYFDTDHIQHAATEAIRLSALGAKGVYYTLNPLKPEVLSRRCNRVDSALRDFHTSSASDVSHRRWLLIDCDPIRTAGVSSTNDEHAASLSVAESIFSWLSSLGWPLPIIADSGNGTHLLYRIDLPTGDGDLIKRILRAVSLKFTTSQIDIDTSVYDPPRICKLYGTVGRKGDSTPDRPHRQSRILRMARDGNVRPVPDELLKALAATAPKEQKAKRPAKMPKGSNTERCRAYVKTIEAAVSGQHGHDQTYYVACIIAKDFSLPHEFGWPILCEFNERCEPPWDEAKLQKKWDDAVSSSGETGSLLADTRQIPSGMSHNNQYDPLEAEETRPALPVTGVESPPWEAPAQSPPQPEECLFDPTTFDESLPDFQPSFKPTLLIEMGAVESIRDSSLASKIKAAVAREKKQEVEKPEPQFEGRMEIEVTEGAEYVVNDLASIALQNDLTIYCRSGQLVQIAFDKKSGHSEVMPVKQNNLRERLSRVAAFTKTTELRDGTRTSVLMSPPEWCYRAIMERYNWPNLRQLRAVIGTPILRPDGSILDQPGYDPSTTLFFQPRENYSGVKVPSLPTLTDAKDAAWLLLDLVSDFPFASHAHQSGWVAFLLTVIGRQAFTGPSPLFLIDANTAGSGKSKLTDIVSLIATGSVQSRLGNMKNDEEASKKIMSIALRGDPITVIDNSSGRLGCDQLEAAITSETWTDRILGASRMVTVPLMTTWAATGNNIDLTPDMVRRTCHIRLNSPDVNPEARTGFKHEDIIGHVITNRQTYLSACLTILRAYIISGRPKHSIKPWGTMDNWSALIREAIVWAGMVDPGETRTMLAAQVDCGLGGIVGLIESWDKIDPMNAGLTTHEIISKCDDVSHWHPHVRESLYELCGLPMGKPISPRLLSAKLRVMKEKRFEKYHIVSVSVHSGYVRWHRRSNDAIDSIDESINGNATGMNTSNGDCQTTVTAQSPAQSPRALRHSLFDGE